MQHELLEYQKIDGELRRIKRDLEKSTNRIEGMKYAKLRQETEDTLAKLDAKAIELQNSLKSLAQNKDKVESTLNEYVKALQDVNDETELNYLNKKMSSVLESLRSCEHECNSIVKDADELEQKYKELTAKLADYIAGSQKCTKQFNTEKEQIQPRIAQLMKQKQELEPKLDKDKLEKYKLILQQNIFPVLVALRDQHNCGGCRMEISSGSLNKLKEEGIVKCEHCGRIVYEEN